MNDSKRPPSSDPAVPEAAAEASVARRRAVLRRLGSGAALAAAGSPLKALAVNGRMYTFHRETPNTKVKATVSGMQSVITSNMTADWQESRGLSSAYYQDTATWPKNGSGQPFCYGVGGTAFTKTARYRDVFACAGGGVNDDNIQNIMRNQTAPHCNWVTACLNATRLGSDFSYSAGEVVALHNDATRNLDALTFFKYYQENYNA